VEKYPFYLILFALNYSFMKLLPLQDLVLVPLALIVIEGMVFAGIYFRAKDILRAGFLTFLVFGWALYFGMGAHLANTLLHTEYNLGYLLLILLPWTIVFVVLGSNRLWRWGKFPQLVTPYLNIVMIAITMVSSYHLVTSLVNSKTHIFFEPLNLEADPLLTTTKDATELPDIYYIILDGYGRQDTLMEYMNFDNSQFIDYLESRGFYVADQSQANYDHTTYSISSSLNMNYIEPISRPVNIYAYKELAISENRARMFLSELGYRFVTFYTPFSYTDVTDSDHYFPLKNFTRAHTQRLAELLLPGSLAAIPLEANIIFPSGRYRDYQEFLQSSLQQVTEISREEGPNFVFFHVLVPHYPYIFDQNGSITPDRPYLLFRDYRGSVQERVALYRGQAMYISLQMETMIDMILISSTVPPIIIIQGDHGPGFDFDSNNTTICLRDRISILNAYYLPGLASNPIYNTITPVNTFRVIFNQYFGADFELLDDTVYYNGNSEAFTFTDVTLESQKECVLP
jgi:hypothetical protein